MTSSSLSSSSVTTPDMPLTIAGESHSPSTHSTAPVLVDGRPEIHRWACNPNVKDARKLTGDAAEATRRRFDIVPSYSSFPSPEDAAGCLMLCHKAGWALGEDRGEVGTTHAMKQALPAVQPDSSKACLANTSANNCCD